MGGRGSGRRGDWGVKNSTDDYRSIDVRRWEKAGLLAPYQSFDWQWSRDGAVVASIHVRTEPDRVILTYRYQNGGDYWQDVCYPIDLDWTACHLGGQRQWFLCPTRDCGRRVAILYGGGIFACRYCHDLAYPSQREVGYDRAARRANKIRQRLGWEQGVLNRKGWRKPVGMHWTTFSRLNKEHDAFVSIALAGIATRLKLLS